MKKFLIIFLNIKKIFRKNFPNISSNFLENYILTFLQNFPQNYFEFDHAQFSFIDYFHQNFYIGWKFLTQKIVS